MKNLKYIYLSIIILFAAACSNDDHSDQDTQPPTITILKPTKDQVFESGDDLHIEVKFVDNTALASYKIEIHHGGDGHGHGTDIRIVEWEYEVEGSLPNSKEYTLHLEIAIPAEAEEGEYHLGLYALDTSGNQGTAWTDFVIENH